jgi:hypothetical protein
MDENILPLVIEENPAGHDTPQEQQETRLVIPLRSKGARTKSFTSFPPYHNATSFFACSSENPSIDRSIAKAICRSLQEHQGSVGEQIASSITIAITISS